MTVITVEVTISADDADWAQHWGLEPDEAALDARTYLTSPEALGAIRAAVAGITGGPITVTAIHAPDLIGELFGAVASDSETELLMELVARAGIDR